jgi:hypothetical protein
MASFDFGSVSAYKFALLGNITGNTNTVAIDTKGFEGVAVVSTVGTSNLNVEDAKTISLTFKEGDDTNISNAVALNSKYIISNPTLGASNTAYWASVVPAKRYLFATLLPTASVAANVSVSGALGFAHDAPTQ